MKLTGIIIAKNAEELLTDCLKSISFCDEIIVVDGGSTDKTLEVAKKFRVKLITCDVTSFAEQRNIGLQHASGEWVLYIDTDERVSTELAANIKRIVSSSIITPHLSPLPEERKQEEFAAYKVRRKNFYFGNHEWPKIEKLERLIKRENLKKWEGRLHETPIIVGDIGELDGYLLHYTHRDLTSMLQKTIIWSQVEAELRFKSNHPQMRWWRFPRVMLTAFYDSYIRQQGYKAGTAGIVESIYQAFSMFITYARLWEMQKKNSN